MPALVAADGSAALTVALDRCEPLGLELRDLDGIPVTPSWPVRFEFNKLRTSLETLEIFADAACTTPLALLELRAGQPQARFYGRASAAGVAPVPVIPIAEDDIAVHRFDVSVAGPRLLVSDASGTFQSSVEISEVGDACIAVEILVPTPAETIATPAALRFFSSFDRLSGFSMTLNAYSDAACSQRVSELPWLSGAAPRATVFVSLAGDASNSRRVLVVAEAAPGVFYEPAYLFLRR
jgi:hypothetical protein